MKKIGLMVAVEIDSVLKSDFTLKQEIKVGKFSCYEYEYGGCQIYAIASGAGQTYAAAATEILISTFKCEMVLNFGVVGSLKDEISLKNVCIVDKVVDYQYDTSELDKVEVGRHMNYDSIYISTNEFLKDKVLELYPDLIKVTCASGNKFVGTKEEKESLRNEFNADIVEMECAAVQIVCDMHNVPALFIKGISDSLSGGANEFEKMLNESSDATFNILKSLIDKI